MNIQRLEEDFYCMIKKSLIDFSKTDKNKAVYALVFDCDSSVGQICLRYGNEEIFQENLKDFNKYAYMYKPYGKYGLHGMKYSVGDFGFIDWEMSEKVEYFLDSYYYYSTGDYFGKGEPMKVLKVNGKELKEADLKKNIKDIWENLILTCIKRLKKCNDVGIDTTEDFIIFMCGHDISNEELEIYIRKTTEDKLFKKLLAESSLI